MIRRLSKNFVVPDPQYLGSGDFWLRDRDYTLDSQVGWYYSNISLIIPYTDIGISVIIKV